MGRFRVRLNINGIVESVTVEAERVEVDWDSRLATFFDAQDRPVHQVVADYLVDVSRITDLSAVKLVS
jgi:hypothetical protein